MDLTAVCLASLARLTSLPRGMPSLRLASMARRCSSLGLSIDTWWIKAAITSDDSSRGLLTAATTTTLRGRGKEGERVTEVIDVAVPTLPSFNDTKSNGGSIQLNSHCVIYAVGPIYLTTKNKYYYHHVDASRYQNK